MPPKRKATDISANVTKKVKIESGSSSSAETEKEEVYHYVICTEGSSNKFYEIRLCGTKVLCRYGRRGAPGSTMTKEFDSVEKAKDYIEDVLDEKGSKGYYNSTPPPGEREQQEIKEATVSAAATITTKTIIRTEKKSRTIVKKDESAAKPQSTPTETIYLECTIGGSNKFYEMRVISDVIESRYGRIGSDGAVVLKSYGSHADALSNLTKIANEKIEKGYVDRSISTVNARQIDESGAAESKEDDDFLVEKQVINTVAVKEEKENTEPQTAKISSPATQQDEQTYYLECIEGGSSKFYEVVLSNCTVKLRYGRIGAEGVRSEKIFPNEEKAKTFAQKTVLEKRKKGYKEVTPGSSACSSAVDDQANNGESSGDLLEDLEAGRIVYIKGSAAMPYKVRKFNGGYSCSCMGWIMQIKSKGVQGASCKHIKEIRGLEAEEFRCGSLSGSSSTAVVGKKSGSITGKVSLAQQWKVTQNPTGYYMSEKLDGMRAYWAAGKLWTRNGNEIIAPAWFIAGLPEKEDLDGELFLRRQQFDACISIARRTDASEDWRELRYVVFDCPTAAGGIGERLKRAGELLSEESTPFAVLHPHTVCESEEQLMDELARVEILGGEGLMLRHPTAKHRGGRTSDLLKVKTFLDDEALVIDHENGRGKYEGMVGSLICVDKKGTRFKVGSGLSDGMRARGAAPKKGTVITYKYFELTKDGVPRFPTFMRVRPDVDPDVFPH